MYLLHLLRQGTLTARESFPFFLCVAWVISKLRNERGSGGRGRTACPFGFSLFYGSSWFIVLWIQFVPQWSKNWFFLLQGKNSSPFCVESTRIHTVQRGPKNALEFIYIKNVYLFLPLYTSVAFKVLSIWCNSPIETFSHHLKQFLN